MEAKKLCSISGVVGPYEDGMLEDRRGVTHPKKCSRARTIEIPMRLQKYLGSARDRDPRRSRQ